MSADLIARLIEAGTPAALVAEVAMLAARAEADKEAIKSRREKDRERQAALRNNVMSRDTADTTLQADAGVSLDKEIPPRPPKEINPIPVREISPRAKAHRLPSDWEPQPLNGVSAERVSVWPPGMLERELSQFRDHWAASATPNSRKNDWQAAWRTWIGNADERWKKSQPRQNFEKPSAWAPAPVMGYGSN